MTENTAIVTSKAAAYTGASGAIISGLTLNELGVVVGIFVGIAGLLMGQYWSWRKDRREHHEMCMRLKKRRRSQYESEE